jgi:hypothetical protein
MDPPNYRLIVEHESLSMYGYLSCRSVIRMSDICCVAVLAATNSDPYVAVSTVGCLRENQS